MLELHSGEKLELTVRKHWLVFVLSNLHLPILAILPLVFSGMFVELVASWPLVESVGSLDAFTAFLYVLWLLALWLVLAVDFTNYYLDVWYVTDERLIDVEQKGIFYRDEATTRLELIQDVTVETAGILATFFRFGDIRVQTAAQSREFCMESVADPESVKRQISTLARHRVEKPKQVEVVSR